MGNLLPLMKALNCLIPEASEDPVSWFHHREAIVAAIAAALQQRTTAEALALLEPMGIWCAPVLNYQEATRQEGYRVLGMEQQVELPGGDKLTTTRCPIRIDGERLYSSKAAPHPGADTARINQEFNLNPAQPL
jgi:crotonobetainyl-CoA:carnitine CoA-transferase CaiB-like acyl-CoA transferase